MAITDASTSVSTTWAEYATVDFTAGSLADIDDCVTEVQSKLNRGTLSASTKPTTTEVKRWLVRCKQEISESKGYTWTRKYAYASTVASQSRYALPPDFNGGYVALKDTTNDRYITLWPEYHMDAMYPDRDAETANEPQIGTIKNMELWLVPPPKAVYTIEIEYDRSGAETTAEDFSWLPEMERFRCCDGAISEAFESLHDWAASDRFKQKYYGGIIKSKKADGRRKWSTMNYRSISIIQEYAAKNNQPS